MDRGCFILKFPLENKMEFLKSVKLPREVAKINIAIGFNYLQKVDKEVEFNI